MDTRENAGAGADGVPARRVEISATQLVAGSAAAVCGAWLASRIGVAGTVIGAGLVSALVTVLSAVYAHGARRAREKLQARIDAVRARGPLPASYAAGAASTGQAGDPSSTAGDGDDALTRTNPLLLPPFDLEDSHGYRWGRIALAGLAVFAFGMAAVTVVELVNGQSFACTTAGIGCDGSTTVPIPGRSRRSTEPTPAPSTTSTQPSAVPSGSTGSSVTVSSTPVPSATDTGSGSPTTSPSSSPSSTATPGGTQSPRTG